jgi:Flp pilus assembly protein TadD
MSIMADRRKRQDDAAVAQAALARGDLESVKACCQRLLNRNQNDVGAMKLYAQALSRQGRFNAAIATLERCVRLRPRDGEAAVLLGQTCFLVDDLEQAMAAMSRCLRYDRRSVEAGRIKATIHDFRGEYDEALATLEGVERAGGADVTLDAVRCMVTLHQGSYEEAVALAEPVLTDQDHPPAVRRMVAYYKGQAHDKLNEADAAMECWALANSLVDVSFDMADFRRQIDAVIEYFTPQRLDQLPRAVNQSSRPVFIAGMPRSGTTLVEQVIDSHPDGRGVGELRDLDRFMRDLPGHLGSPIAYPQCLDAFDQSAADKFGELYLERLDQLVGKAPLRVVNKSLKNFAALGVIGLILPGARIIHTRRDPIDTCLSIYMNPFNTQTAPYAGDLGQLGAVHVQCDRIMAHWKRVLDLPMLEVSYEQMISEPEQTIRSIIEFCDLPWDDRCLTFHESGREVTTLSHHQVRQPIYASAVGRHQRYQAHLGPLLDALGGR